MRGFLQNYGKLGKAGITLALLVFTISGCIPSSATGFSDIAVFVSPGSDITGDLPLAGLIRDSAGALYGVNSAGGTVTRYGGELPGEGTVYKLTPPVPPATAWTTTVLFTFVGWDDGKFPQAGLVMGSTNATFYGTAYSGALECELDIDGCGVLYMIQKPPVAGEWIETVLHTFTGGKDGGHPTQVVKDKTGVLYGLTRGGGDLTCDPPYGCGVIFKYVPTTATFSVLYTFHEGVNGKQPVSLLYDPAGVLFGTTATGGDLTTDCGVAFALSPSGSAYAVLHRFLGSARHDGCGSAAITGDHTALYGTTAIGGTAGYCAGRGCGTAYMLTPAGGGVWTETLLHEFTDSGTNPSYLPVSGLTADPKGTFYGTAVGASDGTVYTLKPPPVPGAPWSFAVVHVFHRSVDGIIPMPGDLLSNGTGAMFGATSMGPPPSQGAIFRIN